MTNTNNIKIGDDRTGAVHSSYFDQKNNAAISASSYSSTEQAILDAKSC